MNILLENRSELKQASLPEISPEDQSLGAEAGSIEPAAPPTSGNRNSSPRSPKVLHLSPDEPEHDECSEAESIGIFRRVRAQAGGCWDEISVGRLMPSARGLVRIKAGWHLEAELELIGGQKQGLRIWARVGESIHDASNAFHERIDRLNAVGFCTKAVHDPEQRVLFVYAETLLPDSINTDSLLVPAIFRAFTSFVSRPELEATIVLGGGRISGFERPSW